LTADDVNEVVREFAQEAMVPAKGVALALGAGGVRAAGDAGDDRNDDGEHDGPPPDGEALPEAVEAGHPPGDVPAAVGGDEQDHDQDDGAGDTDCLGVRCSSVGGGNGVGVGGDPDGGAGRGDQRGEQDRGCGGGEPAEERRADLDPP